MEELIVNGEYYFEQIEMISSEHGGYYFQHGPVSNDKDPNIGELIIILYSNKHPEWVFTFFLVGVSGASKYNMYRLIYKYTGS